MNIQEYIGADVKTVIKDDRFDVENLFNYQLLLELSFASFGFCVIDLESMRCLRLEHYEFNDVHNVDQLLVQMDEIFEEHSFLLAGYWKKISLTVNNHQFSLIPSVLYEKEMKDVYLRLNTEWNEGEQEVCVYRHKSSDLVNVFAVSKKILSYFNTKYPKKDVLVLHGSCSSIEGGLRLGQGQQKLCVNISDDLFYAVVLENGALKYSNSFRFESNDDILYYIMFIIGELKLNQYDIELKLWSNHKLDKSLIEKLKGYVANVSEGKRIKELKFGYFFDEVKDYQFFSLFNQYLCD